MRVYLIHVTVAEERTVRLLGARFDRLVGRWWVDPSWGDIERFRRWLPA